MSVGHAVDSREYDRLVRRIKTLTTVLKEVKAHLGAPQSIAGRQAGHAKTYHNIATLLTRGTEDDAHGSKVIAVTGKSTSEGTVVAISEHDEDEKNADISVGMLPAMQNSVAKEELTVALNIDWIPASEKRLADLGSSDKTDVDITLKEHVGDTISALLQIPPRRDPSFVACVTSFTRFAVRRSCKSMLQRYETRRKIWDKDLFEVLKSWTPELSDTLDEKFIPASSVGIILQQSDIPLVRYGDRDMYAVNIETAASWIWVLAELLSKVLCPLSSIGSMVTQCHRELSTRELNKVMDISTNIDRLLSARVFEAIFNLPSLAQLLHTERLKLQKKDNLRYQDEYEEIQVLSPEEDPFPLRYIRTLVAWHSAVRFLTSRGVLSTGRPLWFAVIRTPHPDEDMESVENVISEEFLASVMRRVFPPESGASDNEKESVLEKLQLAIPYSTKHFCGSVHCEAILMAVKAAANSIIVPPSGIDVHAQAAIFQDIDNVIVVNKKCCWCCDWLGKNLPVPMQECFVLPGTHGKIVPWAPPRFGIPLEVLALLERDLMEELRSAFVERGRTAIRQGRLPSRQSSPASSDDESVLISSSQSDEDWMEDLPGRRV
ncbi:hypothetical protein BKA93DRAFT_822447 [Sparassis latifolia]